MANKTTLECGGFGENAACKFLEKNRYKIVSRNFRYSHYEIDVIAEDKESIVFVEVKTRTADSDGYNRYGRPARAVDAAKQKRLIDAAFAYLRSHPSRKRPRLDVIEVYLCKREDGELEVNKINHIRNAFGR